MKNYRTFLVGLGASIWFTIEPIINTGTFDIHKDWPQLVKAAIATVAGIVAKDANVTGLPSKKEIK